MKTCQRCHTKLIAGAANAAPIPVTYGEMDMTICYRCAVELTVVIGFWLGTEPMEEPKAWVRRLVSSPPSLISVDLGCANCGHVTTVTIDDRNYFEGVCYSSFICTKCGEPNPFRFDADKREIRPIEEAA